MKKKKNNELNKLELVLGGFNKDPWADRKSFDFQLEDHYGTYVIGKGQHFLSYSKRISDEVKHKIIGDLISDDLFVSLLTYSSSDKAEFLFGFCVINKSHELKVVHALMSIGESYETYYWEHWLSLEDGSILNAEETEQYLRSTGGIASYISRNTKCALNESEGIS